MDYLQLYSSVTGPDTPNTPSYARHLLTRERVRGLLDLMADLQALKNKHRLNATTCLTVSPDDFVEFVKDNNYDEGQGPIAALQKRLQPEWGAAFSSRTNHRATVLETPIKMIVQPNTIIWQNEPQANSSDHEQWTTVVYEDTLRVAWCLVCLPDELPQAISDFVIWDPDRLIRWLTTGRISADDGSYKRPFPSMNPDDFASLLQHADSKIREAAIAGLGRFGIDSSPSASTHRLRP